MSITALVKPEKKLAILKGSPAAAFAAEHINIFYYTIAKNGV
jgi:hypothetical protein